MNHLPGEVRDCLPSKSTHDCERRAVSAMVLKGDTEGRRPGDSQKQPCCGCSVGKIPSELPNEMMVLILVARQRLQMEPRLQRR
jgi:hypothetical protein